MSKISCTKYVAQWIDLPSFSRPKILKENLYNKMSGKYENLTMTEKLLLKC